MRGVHLSPVGFLVVNDSGVKILPVDHCSAIDKLLDFVPDALEIIDDFINRDKTYTYEFYEDEDGNCSEECTCGCKDEQNKENENN